jgi:probable F420-dependent oxidoreductase
MKFGYILPNLLSPVSNAHAIKTTARLAEQLGFDSIWATDHVLMPVEFPKYGQGTEAITTLAYLAGITEKITLGLSVLVLPMRNPVIVAKELSSIMHLSGRELILGVGVGWNADEYGFLNANFKQRGKLLDEYVTILKTLWTQEHPEHHGTYSFSGVSFSPNPERVPQIWVGGESEAAIERAARIGDAYHPNLRDSMDYGTVIRRIRSKSGGRHIIASFRATFDLRGGASSTIERLRELEAQGLEYPVVGFKHETLEDLVQGMELFAAEVMPIFRGRS